MIRDESHALRVRLQHLIGRERALHPWGRMCRKHTSDTVPHMRIIVDRFASHEVQGAPARLCRMSYIVGVVQRKGGAGKTTLAVNLGGELAALGFRTALVDADPQGSAADWAAMGRLGYPVYRLPIDSGDLKGWGSTLISIQSEILILDTPAFLNSAVYSAVIIADVLLIPCGPSGLDLAATRQMLGLIDTIRPHRQHPGPVVILVPMRVNARTLEGRMLIGELEALGHAVAPPLGHRTAFLRAFATGESVATYAPDSPADEEMRALVSFIGTATWGRLAGARAKERQ
jgi:chromosome partitioning protein